MLSAGSAEGQSADAGRDSSKAVEPRGAYAIWTTSAKGQPLATRFGARHDRALFFIGVQKYWPIRSNPTGGTTLEYSVDLLPLVVSTAMPTYYDQFGPCGESLTCLQRATASELHTAYGFGAMPIGFIARVPVTHRLDLQFRLSGGALYFSRVIPDPAGRRFNFVADGGAGVGYRIASDLALTAGLRLNHISNGNTGHVNPGMNSVMTEIGLAFPR